MNRLLAVVLVASVGQSSVAFAAGPIAASAVKASKQTAAAVVQTSNPSPSGFASFAAAAHVGSVPAGAVLAQQAGAGTISQSGLSKKTKTMIFVGAAVAFVGTAYGIDHRVRDVTPSSLGQRHDEDVFKK